MGTCHRWWRRKKRKIANQNANDFDKVIHVVPRQVLNRLDVLSTLMRLIKMIDRLRHPRRSLGRCSVVQCLWGEKRKRRD